VKNDTEEKRRSNDAQTDTRKWKTTPKRNDAQTTLKEKQIHSLDEAKKSKGKTTFKRRSKKRRSKKSRITRKKTTRKETSKPQALVIREIKLTYRKNGH